MDLVFAQLLFVFCGANSRITDKPFYAIGSELFDFHQIRFSFGETTEEASRK
jgi:hypothetical protein